MHANHGAALGAGPFAIFVFNKPGDTEFFYVEQVFDWACSIFCSIAFIQMGQACTGKFAAAEAVLHSRCGALFAGLHLARYAGFGLVRIVTPAARTGFFIS